MCPDSVIQLTCNVTNVVEDELFHWFIDSGVNSNFVTLTRIDVNMNIVAPERVEVLLDWLTGLEVYVVNVLFNNNNNTYSFQSTLSLNTSLYRSNITRHVKCGLMNSMSNNVSLHFLTVSKLTVTQCKKIRCVSTPNS